MGELLKILKYKKGKLAVFIRKTAIRKKCIAVFLGLYMNELLAIIIKK